MYNNEYIIMKKNSGEELDYLFFWGHRKSDKITKSCFSQWYEASFVMNDIEYKTAEHYMMAQKAKLFNDTEAFHKILMAKTPKEAKELGRSVKNFKQSTWEAVRLTIVTAGNLAKFQQNPKLKEFLLNTGDKIIVEASPYDAIWGIKMDQHHADAKNPAKWKGLNLLGYSLMAVRNFLKHQA